MNITNYFGEYLSKLTDKDPRACRGMIRIAVKEKFPNKTPEQLDYDELKDVFNTTLKKRLERVYITNIDQITEEITIYLVKNQSLLTMA